MYHSTFKIPQRDGQNIAKGSVIFKTPGFWVLLSKSLIH